MPTDPAAGDETQDTGDTGAGTGDTSGSGGSTTNGASHSDGELRQAIRDVLTEMGIGARADDKGGDTSGAGGNPPAPRGAVAQTEAHWEEIVRRELEKVKTAQDVAGLKEQIKQIVEKPPKQYRRVTRALWGGDDE
jgi:hypothetical protein